MCTNLTCTCTLTTPPNTGSVAIPGSISSLPLPHSAPTWLAYLLYVNLFYFIRPFAWYIKVAELRKWKARETSKKILATWGPYSCPASQKITATPLPAPFPSMCPCVLPISSIANRRKEA